jgi:uncharacterized protein (DUF427 family)
MKPQPITPAPGQESVWDYPRPPQLELTRRHVKIIFNGVVIAESDRAYRVLETSHPPSYYIPPQDVRKEHLRAASGSSLCEWKGQASYYSVVVGDKRAVGAAWSYHNPTAAFARLKDHIAFYPAPMDVCYVDGERVQPQPGNFYGGWITSDIVGPFKGEPGSWGW